MAKAVTLKNQNDEEVYPVTDISLVNGTITTGRIADAAVTQAKLASNIQAMELIQETRLSGTTAATNLDIPIDFSTYDAYYIYGDYVAGASSTNWDTINVLNASKGGASTTQQGYQIESGNSTIVSRSNTSGESLAYGSNNSRLSSFQFEIRAINAVDWPWCPFRGNGTDNYRTQFMQGAVKEKPSTIKYVRIHLSGGVGDNQNKFQVFATRRRS